MAILIAHGKTSRIKKLCKLSKRKQKQYKALYQSDVFKEQGEIV